MEGRIQGLEQAGGASAKGPYPRPSYFEAGLAKVPRPASTSPSSCLGFLRSWGHRCVPWCLVMVFHPAVFSQPSLPGPAWSVWSWRPSQLAWQCRGGTEVGHSRCQHHHLAQGAHPGLVAAGKQLGRLCSISPGGAGLWDLFYTSVSQPAAQRGAHGQQGRGRPGQLTLEAAVEPEETASVHG